MAPKSKQADRNSAKRAAKKVDEDPDVPVNRGNIVALVKGFALGSVLATVAPKLPAILKEEATTNPAKVEGDVKPEDVPEKTEGEGEAEGAEESEQPVEAKQSPGSAADIFQGLQTRVAPLNGLGLFASGAAAKEAFLKTKGLSFDGGPKPKKKGTPGVDRVVANGRDNMLQYVHFLFALMMLRAFLFRSFFAFLPWLFFYQFVSLALPVTPLSRELKFAGKQLPEVFHLLEKCPLKFRVAGTVGLHALVWFFFLYEVVLRTYFFEKVLLVGLLAAHAYLVAPVEP